MLGNEMDVFSFFSSIYAAWTPSFPPDLIIDSVRPCKGVRDCAVSRPRVDKLDAGGLRSLSALWLTGCAGFFCLKCLSDDGRAGMLLVAGGDDVRLMQAEFERALLSYTLLYIGICG